MCDGASIFSEAHIILIAACDCARGIGKGGEIPWDCQEDRLFFRRQTMGKPLLMGRRTYESLPIRPLPGRPCAVWSRRERGETSDVLFHSDLSALVAWGMARGETLYGAGGAQLYRACLPYSDAILLSRIPSFYDCDCYFPEIPEGYRLEKTVEFSTFKLEYWINSRKRTQSKFVF